MNLSTRSHPELVLPMLKPKSTLCTSHSLSFETTRNEPHDDVLISAWKAALNDESKPKSSEATAAANEEESVEQEGRQIENYYTNEEDVIAREVKSTGKELIADKMGATVAEDLGNGLRKTLHDMQNGSGQSFKTLLSR